MGCVSLALFKKNTRLEEIEKDEDRDVVICPFCGKSSKSIEYCSNCNTRLTKEVLKYAYTKETDPRNDKIGPFSTKAANKIAWACVFLFLLLFIILTELSGNGFSSMGK